MKTMFIKYWSK